MFAFLFLKARTLCFELQQTNHATKINQHVTKQLVGRSLLEQID